MAVHDIGDLVTLWSVWRDETGEQTAPSGLILTVQLPDRTSYEETVTEAAAEDEAVAEAALGEVLDGITGVYRASVDVTQAGRWHYDWTVTGEVQEREAGSFYVRRRTVGEVGS